MADAQNLVAAKVNFELWCFPCNQPNFTSRGLQLRAEAGRFFPRFLSEGPTGMISLLTEGAWLVNEAFSFSGVLKSNSVIITACYDSYSRTYSSNNTSVVRKYHYKMERPLTYLLPVPNDCDSRKKIRSSFSAEPALHTLASSGRRELRMGCGSLRFILDGDKAQAAKVAP